MPTSAIQRGVHLTPEGLARELAQALLGDSPVPPILDPACGEGALLIAAWRVASSRGLRPDELHGIELDAGRARRAQDRLRAELGGRAGEAAARNIRVADALHPTTPWPAATAILANPPWVSFSGRQKPKDLGEATRPAPPAGWPSLHGAFLERIADHIARNRTRAAVLVPSALCELDRYGPTRARVLAHARPDRPARALGEGRFPGVVEPAALLVLAPSTGNGDASPWRFEETGARLGERLARFPRLPPACFGDIGVHSGNSAARLILESGPGLPGVREGRDLAPFRLGPARRVLDTGLERSRERRFRYGPLETYSRVPVLLRQTADRPMAALHSEPTYFRNSLLACRPPADLDPAFAVGVLNHPLIARWHRESFLDARQRSFPQVKVSHLRRIPFPILDRSQAPSLHDRVARAVRDMLEPGAPFDERRRELEHRLADAYGEPLASEVEP